MPKKVELILGGQYKEKNRPCDGCETKNRQIGGKGISTVPETIYLVVFEEGNTGANYYCPSCGKEYLRSLEQHLQYNPEEYAGVHKTPQQIFNEEQEAKKSEANKRKEMWEKLNNR